jgi:uncharacterized UBP type Zn finger protein
MYQSELKKIDSREEVKEEGSIYSNSKKNDNDTDHLKPLSKSKVGLVGLQNIGNTCFMYNLFYIYQEFRIIMFI